MMALRASWRAGECDPFDAERHDPAFALPVYTRLSDAEENERQRLARADRRPGGQAGLAARDHERHGHRQPPGPTARASPTSRSMRVMWPMWRPWRRP
ncbi:MAG: hypothetical protein ACLTDR_01285 [Adlercreutzia equolifaciens]